MTLQIPGSKYREIILAVAMFLVLDLSVLILNFFISFQISEDALSINLAGRQRMLSQRITKSLLVTQSSINLNQPYDDALKELNNTTTLFNATLNAFSTGGAVKGSDGNTVQLVPITLPGGITILEQAAAIWTPFLKMHEKLLSMQNSPDTLYQIDTMVRYAMANNLKLLDLMNQLTTELEKSAGAKANTLRLIQTAGILLALLNFGFILFKFIRRLRENDRKIEIAQNENQEILDTVKEGLFLLDQDFRIGTQISSSLESILRRPIRAGTSLRDILRDMLPPETFANACDYISLLFSAHIKEGLLGDLNPLEKIEVTLPDSRGKPETRYLTFYFSRVQASGNTIHLLVTLFDMTQEVELSRALGEAKEEARQELEWLVSLLRVDPLLLKNFIAQSQTTLLEINDELRSVGNDTGIHPIDYRRTVDHVFRKAHTFKGDAAMLGLEAFEALAHKLESALVQLRGKHEIHGEDLLSLPFYLEEILQRIGMADEMMKKLSSYHDAFSPALSLDTFASSLEQLASRIALDHDKSIKLVTDLKLMSQLSPGVMSELKEIVVQLLRNAVVHGIENADERQKAGKKPTGNIHISLQSTEDGMFEFSLLDDGRGLVPAKIRSTLLRSGKYTHAQLAELSDKQILMKIFEPGFTTALSADKHAGHGVGLDVVQKKIENLGASLRISTQKNTYTQFSILFPA